ncbi:MAG: ATP-binding cassette domain-containing protein [Desulfovermiculus sp.]|nr:ATP-binding cassette domain-containing protein [Desulfovermiculus sp.]
MVTEHTSQSILEISGLTVFFENALALNEVSLYANKSEIVGIFGSNSAGKTTLANCISGLILEMKKKEARRGGQNITISGQIFFNGEDILYASCSYRVKNGLGLTRERHPIFRDSNVLENLKIAGHVRNKKDIAASAQKTMDFFPHLRNLSHQKAGFLSGGEQQMLAIAMALMVNPRFLVLDEPLLGLSPAVQADLVKTIRDIRNEGITVLVTEQFARPLLPLIDRGYIIENGIVILSGTGEELMHNPEVRSGYFST